MLEKYEAFAGGIDAEAGRLMGEIFGD